MCIRDSLKRSMLDKMPGDMWQKFANLRLLYAYMWSHPGKKLLFMGGEIGQWTEWSEAKSLDWGLLDDGPHHSGVQDLVRQLNYLYGKESALYEIDYSWDGFKWIDLHNSQNSVLAFSRHNSEGDSILVVCNFTPIVREGYRLGVPQEGVYEEILNTDAAEFGGSDVVNEARASEPTSWHEQQQSIVFSLPPLAAVYWKLKAD